MINKLSGKVIHGDHYGKTLGFPTANLDRRDYVQKKMKVRFGIYSGWTQILDLKPALTRRLRRGRSKILTPSRYKSAIVIGPLDKNCLPKIEAHLIGFKGNLYGKQLIIYPKKYLRAFKKFKDEAALKDQIKLDLKKIKQVIK